MTKSFVERLSPVGGQSTVRRSLVVLALSVATTVWAAPSVNFAVTDLPDVVIGEDLWSYDYTITGPLASFETVNLLFSSLSYGGYILVNSSDASLSPLVTVPIIAPATDGLVAVTAIDPVATNGSALLSVHFVWTAAGAPGSQPFEVLDDQFNVVSTGMTSAVPEASTAALLAAGLLAMTPLMRRRVRR